MPAWWQRVFTKPIPDTLLALAAAAKKDTSPPIGPAPSAADPLPPPAREYDITAADRDPRQMLARLEEEEARLHRRYMDALKEGASDFDLDQHRNRWTETSNLLQLQRGRLDKSKTLLTPGEVNAAFQRLVVPLPAALERAFPQDLPPDTIRAAIRTAFQRLPATLEEMLA